MNKMNGNCIIFEKKKETWIMKLAVVFLPLVMKKRQDNECDMCKHV